MPEVFKIDKKGKLGPDNVKPNTVVDKMCLPGLTDPKSVKTFLTFFCWLMLCWHSPAQTRLSFGQNALLLRNFVPQIKFKRVLNITEQL